MDIECVEPLRENEKLSNEQKKGSLNKIKLRTKEKKE